MKPADLLHLQSVRLVLLITALVGAFFLGRCSRQEPPDEPPPAVSPRPERTEQKNEQAVEQVKFRFDEQCRDVLYEIQACIVPVCPSAGQRNRSSILILPEQKKTLPHSIILLQPSGKKKRIAPPGRSVQEAVPDVFGRDDGQVVCKGDLISAVLATVAALEDQSILYGIGPLSDCSGIFHRVLMGVKKRFPAYAYPSPEQYRDSRDLARWYHERGELILIRNAVLQSDLIRPGMVLFFGRGGTVYRNFTVQRLLNRQGGIHHVGVVTRVHKDRAGQVVGYELFHGHGRRGRTAASITRWHERRPSRAGYPPFGNGREQLVAVARIVRP
jgi:hypothetical protein